MMSIAQYAVRALSHSPRLPFAFTPPPPPPYTPLTWVVYSVHTGSKIRRVALLLGTFNAFSPFRTEMAQGWCLKWKTSREAFAALGGMKLVRFSNTKSSKGTPTSLRMLYPIQTQLLVMWNSRFIRIPASNNVHHC